VVHRDIKLENILLDGGAAMKIIDFGLAAFYQPGKKLRVHCGSPSYAAPEIVSRKLYEGPPVDVWSLGVVTFAMVAGYLPFHASNGNKQVGAARAGARRPPASPRPASYGGLCDPCWQAGWHPGGEAWLPRPCVPPLACVCRAGGMWRQRSPHPTPPRPTPRRRSSAPRSSPASTQSPATCPPS
jgi:serine/threonine protein kinase